MSQNESTHFPTANSIYWYTFLIRCSVNKRICCKVFNAFPIGRIGAFTTHTRWTSSRTMFRWRPKRLHRRRFHPIRWRRHHRAAGSWKKMPGFSDSVLVGWNLPGKRSSLTNWFIESVWYVDSGHARWDEWKSSITRSIYTYILIALYIYIIFFFVFFWYLYPGICVITWMGICRGNHEGLGVGFSNQKCM